MSRILVVALLLGCAGCSSLIASATSGLADNLTAAILEQDDPGLVRDGVPAYLLLLDSLTMSENASSGVLGAAAQLYAAYAVTFVSDAERSKRLSARGYEYGRRAVCDKYRPACAWGEADFDEFSDSLGDYPAKGSDALYAYSVSWLAWLRAHSDDWSALTDLPRVEAA
ncbi:MAG: TRAP transporter TatT component family protein, partial [Gammaproteobacteria bacterium]|nr:TRAP transporter TatT component family protein [Gammaproteobacteria bacterium]